MLHTVAKRFEILGTTWADARIRLEVKHVFVFGGTPAEMHFMFDVGAEWF